MSRPFKDLKDWFCVFYTFSSQLVLVENHAVALLQKFKMIIIIPQFSFKRLFIDFHTVQ